MRTHTLRNPQYGHRKIPRTYKTDQMDFLLDRYGIGYICRYPTILFPEYNIPVRQLADPFMEDGTLHTYLSSRRYLEAKDAPENTIDRMTEAYRILGFLYAPWTGKRI